MKYISVLKLTYTLVCFFLIQSVRAHADAPDFCMVSIAKSGTHLAAKAIYALTGKERVFAGTKDVNTKLKGSQYLGAHPVFSRTMDAVKDYEKVIVVVRDPRDVFVSSARYYRNPPFMKAIKQFSFDTKIDSSEFVRQWKALTFDEKLSWMISEKYIKESFPFQDFTNLLKWLENHSSSKKYIVVRYEDLVGTKGGGTKKRQVECLKKLASFLNISLSSSKLNSIAGDLWGVKKYDSWDKYKTFAVGETQQFRKYMNKHQIERVSITCKKAMHYFGYSQ